MAWGPGSPPGLSREFFFEKGRGPKNLEIRLPRPGKVSGRVLPPQGARITAEATTDLPFPPFLPFQREITGLPGPGGRFILGPLTPGTRRIRFSAPGRVSLVRPVRILSGKTQDLGTVSLLPGVVVGGILLGPTGKPEPGGRVWLRPVSGGSPRKTTAGPGGRFRFPPVPPGKYFIQGCRRDAGALTALDDYAATKRLLVLSGRTYWIKNPISLEKRR
ncbi:MAG TPA: carboxypeptidase regulatory-like domain-containing protein [Planctomycetes bacterium]|nr:carboxypeptidase regulatory-like domain-containing protein [Planctomycetota bacterium]